MTWLPSDSADIEVRKLLVNMRYVELGLVPPAQYPLEEKGSLEACLSSLSPEERKRACRKFRKLVRKVRRKKVRTAGFYTKQRAVKYKIELSLFAKAIDNDE